MMRITCLTKNCVSWSPPATLTTTDSGDSWNPQSEHSNLVSQHNYSNFHRLTPLQVLKAAWGHWGKSRNEIINIIFQVKDLGINPKVPAMIITGHVESLSINNWFLHAPYVVSNNWILSQWPAALTHSHRVLTCHPVQYTNQKFSRRQLKFYTCSSHGKRPSCFPGLRMTTKNQSSTLPVGPTLIYPSHLFPLLPVRTTSSRVAVRGLWCSIRWLVWVVHLPKVLGCWRKINRGGFCGQGCWRTPQRHLGAHNIAMLKNDNSKIRHNVKT